MGSAAAHEVAGGAPTAEVEGDNLMAANALWTASLEAVEAAIAATAPRSDGRRGSSGSGGLAEEQMAEVLRKFCEDAIDGVPLPKPWSLQRDALGRACFVDRSTGASRWAHPLGPALVELCALCRAYFGLPADARPDLLAAARVHWEAEAKRECGKWHGAEHASGRTYYRHEESGRTTWDHPGSVVLPQYYMRLRAISRLCKGAYLDQLSEALGCVRVGCVVDRSVHPAEERDVAHRRAGLRQPRPPQPGDRAFQAGGADRYPVRSCAATVAMQGRLQHFDLTAGDDALEEAGRMDMLAPPDPLSRWYEVY